MSETKDYMHRSHPWHGVFIGEEAPKVINCYIEIVPTDTIKYELDKDTGILKIDRPLHYSSLCPSLYGLVPQTYCGDRVGKYCMEKTGRKGIVGDGDPLDICVLTESVIPRGDIFLKAIPIGGFRLIDRGQSDDKIISVLAEDLVYGEITDISQCHEGIIKRLYHYFMTYKDFPSDKEKKVEITHIFGAEEAFEVIQRSRDDYLEKFQ